MSETGSSPTMLSRVRLVLWALVLVTAIGATVIFSSRLLNGDSSLSNDPTPIGGEFALQTASGEPFTEESLAGTPALVFFGYTFCPDVCPTTLAETTAWRQQLNLTEDDLRIIFVTVDPTRDTAEVLSQYLSVFSGPVIGVTGDEAETEKAKQGFGVFSERTDIRSETDYLVNHTATIFMVDSDGKLFGTIAFGEDPDTARGKIERLVGA